MTEDYTAFFRAICEFPHDDMPRLVYADWLEERAKLIPCDYKRDGSPDFPCRAGQVQDTIRYKNGVYGNGWRECPKCKGAEVVSDGLAERAEFIRVQIELRHHCWQCDDTRVLLGCAGDKENPPCPRCEPLAKRERELLVAFGPMWYDEFGRAVTGGTGCAAWSVDGPQPDGIMVFSGAWCAQTMPFGRGFVGRFTTQLDWWAGGECRTCADGEAYYNTPGQERDAPCPRCKGTGRTKAHGPEVVARQPVTRVVVPDAVPFRGLGGPVEPWWMWVRASNAVTQPDPHSIPDDIWVRLPEHGLVPSWSSRDVGKRYRSRKIAFAALSHALVGGAREAADLPPLPPEVTP